MISDNNRRRLANIERLAKDDSIPFKMLKRSLVQFMYDTNYIRTPYQINVPLVFRARAKSFGSEKEAGLYFNHQDKFSYPDVQKVVLDWGRCNGPDEAVFYCGDENVIPMFEVRPEQNDYLVLGGYRHRFQDTINLILPVIGVEQIVSELSQRDKSNSLVKILANDMHYRKNVSPEVLAIDKHFSSWYTQLVANSCKYYYKLTTALYQAFVNNISLGPEIGSFNGLMYPSVASDTTGINLALKTNFVDTHLKLIEAKMYKVETVDLEAKRFCLQPIKQLAKIYRDGSLEWEVSAMINERFRFEPSTPTYYINPPADFLDGISVLEK